MSAVVWESQDPTSKAWTRFAPDDSKILEAAFAKKTPAKLDFGGKPFTVDFTTLKMTGGKADPVRAVRRAGGADAATDAFLNTICGGAAVLSDGDQFMRVFEALGVNPEGVESFVLFYKAGAATPLSISRDELATLFSTHGLPKERAGAQRKVQEWTTRIMAGAAEDFDPFYNFVWKWNRASPTASIITLDVAFPVWRLVTSTLRLPLLEPIITFL